MRVSVIIPVYIVNDELKAMTDGCLESFIKYTPDQNIELLVVDDGSQEEYKTEIGHLIRLDENSGYLHAVNTALERAEGDIIVIGNNDLTFHQNWLTELLFPLNIGYDIATCWSSDQKGVKLVQRIEAGAKFGSLLAMNREVYSTLGGFDETFRGYFTGLDYWKRAKTHGFRIGKNCDMVIEHKAKSTYSVVDTDDFEYEKAKVLYEQKHGGVE